jgi:hypothetical protein
LPDFADFQWIRQGALSMRGCVRTDLSARPCV